MFKLITIVAAMIACVAAAPGYASLGLGHGPILGAPLALSAPISYAAPITKIAAPIAPISIAKIAAPSYSLGGLIGAPIAKIGAPLSLGYGHGLGGPIW